MRHFENNPRQITKAQFERLKETMSEFGDLSGIVHNLETDEIIGGNQRSEAAELLNKEPVITERFDPPLEDGTVALGYFDYKGRRFQYRAVRWDADKAMRANLVANVGGGSWDWDALSSFPAEMLDSVGFDHDLLMNYSNDFRALGEFIQAQDAEKNPLSDAEPEIDRAAELLEKWQVKTGDLWQIGEHRLLCGDSTKREDVERVMGGEKAGCCITDPPYGQNQLDVPGDDPEENQTILAGCVENMPIENGIVIAFESPRTFQNWLSAIHSHKFQRALWLYKEAQEAHPWRGWIMKSELILISEIGKGEWLDVHPFAHDCYKVSEVSFRTEQIAAVRTHGSVKPLTVVQDLVSRVGGDVYEPFAGSGTTIVACQNLGRKCRAIEISPAYVAVALERFSVAFPDAIIERIGQLEVS